jgi:hypothetical protein
MLMSNFSGSDQIEVDTIAFGGGVRKVCLLAGYRVTVLSAVKIADNPPGSVKNAPSEKGI